MITRTIEITELDSIRLKDLIESALLDQREDRKHLRDFQREISHAKIVRPRAISKDVITVNSTVRLKDLDTGEDVLYSLVFPKEANLFDGKISVLAPLGTAILGHKVGETVEWTAPAGLRRVKVEDVQHHLDDDNNFCG